MFPTIDSVAIQPNQQLLLHYRGGEEVHVDFQSVIERGGGFASLADPQFFAQVKVGERGRYIEWPGNLDFCADALWQQGQHRTPHNEADGPYSDAAVEGSSKSTSEQRSPEPH